MVSGYYTAILSGKEDHGLWSSTAKHFAISPCASTRHAGKLIQSCWDLVHSECKCKTTSCVGEKGACKLLCCAWLSSIDRSHFYHSKWRCSIRISVHYPFHVWWREVMTSIAIDCVPAWAWSVYYTRKYTIFRMLTAIFPFFALHYVIRILTPQPVT